MCAECDCGSAWFPGLTLEHCIWAEGLCRHPGPPFTFSGHQQLLGGLPFVDVFCEVKVILSCIENLTSLSYMRPLSKRKEEKRKEEGRGKEGEGEVWTGCGEGRREIKRGGNYSHIPCSLSSQVLRKASLLLSVVAAPPQTLPALSQRLLWCLYVLSSLEDTSH